MTNILLDTDTVDGYKNRITELRTENKQLRIAMDYLLRRPVGIIPKEADRFYDGERATFQENKTCK